MTFNVLSGLFVAVGALNERSCFSNGAGRVGSQEVVELRSETSFRFASTAFGFLERFDAIFLGIRANQRGSRFVSGTRQASHQLFNFGVEGCFVSQVSAVQNIQQNLVFLFFADGQTGINRELVEQAGNVFEGSTSANHVQLDVIFFFASCMSGIERGADCHFQINFLLSVLTSFSVHGFVNSFVFNFRHFNLSREV